MSRKNQTLILAERIARQLVAEQTTAWSSGFSARRTLRTATGEPQPAHIL